MRCLFSDGIVSFEVSLFCTHLMEPAVCFADIQAIFQADWCYPKGLACARPEGIFYKRREKHLKKNVLLK